MKRTPTVKMPGSETKIERERFRKDDPVNRMYTSGRYGSAWIRLSKIMRGKNPLCQRIIRDTLTGQMHQCHNPSTLVHHLQSPRHRPDLFLEPKNLCCLCDSCHVPDDGTPTWRENVEFVPTEVPSYMGVK